MDLDRTPEGIYPQMTVRMVPPIRGDELDSHPRAFYSRRLVNVGARGGGGDAGARGGGGGRERAQGHGLGAVSRSKAAQGRAGRDGRMRRASFGPWPWWCATRSERAVARDKLAAARVQPGPWEVVAARDGQRCSIGRFVEEDERLANS